MRASTGAVLPPGFDNALSVELLLATQLDRPRRAAEGERRLMVAVLEEGIRTAADLPTAGRKHHEDDIAEAREWVASTARGWPCDFENLCDQLNIDAGRLRQAVLARPRMPIKRRTNAVYRTAVASHEPRRYLPCACGCGEIIRRSIRMIRAGEHYLNEEHRRVAATG